MFWSRKDTEPDVIERFRARRIRADRQKMLVPLLIGAAVTILLLLFAFRPTPLLGVDGRSLQYSFDTSSVASGTDDSCKPRKGNGQWTCFVYNKSTFKEVAHPVSVDRMGCWTGAHTSGCVTILDHIRPFGSLFN